MNIYHDEDGVLLSEEEIEQRMIEAMRKDFCDDDEELRGLPLDDFFNLSLTEKFNALKMGDDDE